VASGVILPRIASVFELILRMRSESGLRFPPPTAASAPLATRPFAVAAVD